METQKFIDLTITFTVVDKKDEKKDEAVTKQEATQADSQKPGDSASAHYEILKDVPDVRVYYGDAKSNKVTIAPSSKVPASPLMDPMSDDY